MGLISDGRKSVALVRKALRSRAAVRDVRVRLKQQGPHPSHHFRVAVYFADGDVNMYQIRQWYKPLAHLAQTWPVVVLARNATGARQILVDGSVPVAFVPTVRDLEQYLATQDIRVVLYVNQNTRNFQMFRYGRRWHVFINHGESDKMYMTTNQFKAYDYAFVAGDAARERLSRVLWDYDIDGRTLEIGRPQADYYSAGLPYRPDGRKVLLYAPTWEGDRPSAHYGSISTHGETLVAAILASTTHRLIYRPHPRSGVVDAAYGAANARIIAAISAANAVDPSAQHVFDDHPELGWQLVAADVAVVDISAMVYDRLAAGKPLMITRPVDSAAIVDTHGYLSDAEWLTAGAAPRILSEVERVLSDAEAVDKLEGWVNHYFGDTAPGAATARFEGAIRELMDRWEQWHTATASDDEDADGDDAELDDE